MAYSVSIDVQVSICRCCTVAELLMSIQKITELHAMSSRSLSPKSPIAIYSYV